MEDSKAPGNPIWAKWKVLESGRITVIVTYGGAGGYHRREYDFASLDEAARTLGSSFRDVVKTVVEAGLAAGRWHP